MDINEDEVIVDPLQSIIALNGIKRHGIIVQMEPSFKKLRSNTPRLAGTIDIFCKLILLHSPQAEEFEVELK